MTVADFANVTINGVTNLAAKACSLNHQVSTFVINPKTSDDEKTNVQSCLM
jgi:hypothetical protein